MSQKSRADLTSVIGSNIFDNNNKEILAAMLRVVLTDFRDSKFNLIDDQLKLVNYNATQTLEQYLNSIIGSLPVYGTVEGINFGLSSGSLTTSGIITSATYIAGTGNDSLIEVNFSQSISNRRLIPVATTTSPNWDAQNDIGSPVLRRISSTRIHVAVRKLAAVTQDINLEIIAL